MDTRRTRALAYFDRKFKNDRAKIMERTGLTKGRLSQIYGDGAVFGEVAARNLAGRLGLEEDYFERDQNAGSVPAPSSVGRKIAARGIESTDQAQAVVETLCALGEQIESLDPLTREQLQPIVRRLLEVPGDRQALAERARAAVAAGIAASAPKAAQPAVAAFRKRSTA